MRKVKHNKIRNTGLLFEFLLRQITSDVLNKNNGTAVKIVKEKFNENTELGKELALYNILITKKFKSDSKADYFINEVMKTRSDLNNSTLRRERYNLILLLLVVTCSTILKNDSVFWSGDKDLLYSNNV